MKLARFYDRSGSFHAGLFVDSNSFLDANGFGEDWNEEFFASRGIARLSEWIRSAGQSAPRFAFDEVRVAPPIARPSKFICIGLNYADHARETGVTPPVEPVIFMKATTALCGPYDNLLLPGRSEKTDWEVELAIVIGTRTKNVSISDAMSRVIGYTLHVDYSEREWQLEGTGQWVKGKSADTFAPLGPFLVTTDEITDVRSLRLWLKVNGDIKQNGNTKDMFFGIPELVSYVSRFMTLLPGDVISTGTPAGVGLGQRPPQFIRNGDVIDSGIDLLGTQRQVAMRQDSASCMS